MNLTEFLEKVSGTQAGLAEKLVVDARSSIPEEDDLRLEVPRWTRIERAVVAYFDLCGSSTLGDLDEALAQARAYELFTGGLLRILRKKELAPGFVEIQGDGGFAIWTGLRAAKCATLTALVFQALVRRHLRSVMRRYVPGFEMSARVAITRGSILAKRVGTRQSGEKRRSWAVWAGRPVSLAAHLCDRTPADQIVLEESAHTALVEESDDSPLHVTCPCVEGPRRHALRRSPEIPGTWIHPGDLCEVHGDERYRGVVRSLSSSRSRTSSPLR